MKKPIEGARKRAIAAAAIVAGLAAAGTVAYLATRTSAAASAAASTEGAASGAQGARRSRAAAAAQAGLQLAAASIVKEEPLIETTGNLEPARAVDLTFSVSGTVRSVAAASGDRVAAGQVLASLDDREARYKVADAEKRLLQARVSGNERDAELIALERELRLGDLEATSLKAPFAGVVSTVSVEVGAGVAAATKAVRLLDRSSLMAVLDIDEIDLPLVKLGQEVSFAFDALPGKTYKGRITLIPQEGTVTNQGLAVFSVEATIATPPAELKPGYSFVAKVHAAEPRRLVVVPTAALAEKNGVTTVLVAKGGGQRPESRVVTAVKRSDGTAEIVQGLSEGERVVVASQGSSSRSQTGAGALGFMVPGLGGPPPGGQPGAQQGGQQGGGQSSGQGTR
ncbi:MAG: efflux RND transporter periplasmic adaptor subunit [Spirochaetaceae bacterium]|nr:efflux RND transporter periplasmic adaptor subunit [Spirochaetaceae bacterium]